MNQHRHFPECAYLDQSIKHFAQPPLYSVSAFVPSPTIQQIVIDRSLIYKYMLRKLSGIIVEKISKSIDSLRYDRGEERVLLRQVL